MQNEQQQGRVFDFKVLQRLFAFAKPYKGVFFILVFLILFSAVLAPVRPYLTQLAIDDYIFKDNVSGLLNIIWLMIGVLFAHALIQFFSSYLSDWLGQHIIRDIRIGLYEHIIQLKLKFFDRQPVGRLITRNISDIETIAEVFSQGVATIISEILQLVFILAFMFYMDWRLTLISLSTLPLLIFATYIFKERIKSAFSAVRTAVANLNTFVQEHITGMSVVQIFNSEERELEKFKKINEEHKRANLDSVKYFSIYFPVAEIIGAIGVGLLIWYGAGAVLKEVVTLGALVAFIQYISMFFRPIRMIADRFNTLQQGIVSADRVLKLIDTDEKIKNTPIHNPESINGKVAFEHVWFAYDKEDFVLKDISFEVPEGKTVALVGATGAGKSSVINILGRFYEINKGDIKIDDRSIRDYDLNFIRRNIGIVLQDVFLFSDTIENNITLGDQSITTQQVYDAAELVGAREFIERLPGGFNYNVQERGATLSVGQRQLISFVRAMVYNPKILVLDEATSSVDTATETMIQQAIDKMMKGRTSLVIAHRLSTIQKASQILVLDKGEIKEAGSHEELLKKEGYYEQLYRMQFKAEV